MVAEQHYPVRTIPLCCSLAKISMVAELLITPVICIKSCSLAKISMVAERMGSICNSIRSCSLAKISMVAELEQQYIR